MDRVVVQVGFLKKTNKIKIDLDQYGNERSAFSYKRKLLRDFWCKNRKHHKKRSCYHEEQKFQNKPIISSDSHTFYLKNIRMESKK